MKQLVVVAVIAIAGCQTAPSSNYEKIAIKASPESVKEMIIAGAIERGTRLVDEGDHFVVLEKPAPTGDLTIGLLYGSSMYGERLLRARLSYAGSECLTTVRQDISIVTNAGTGLEKSEPFPATAQTFKNLTRLKSRSETAKNCI